MKKVQKEKVSHETTVLTKGEQPPSYIKQKATLEQVLLAGTVVKKTGSDVLPNIYDMCVDIETLGTKNNSVVLSIAVIFFDRTAILKNPELSVTSDKLQHRSNIDYLDSFHTPVSMLDCLAAGCVIDKGTAEWWKKQKDRVLLVDSMACVEPLQVTMTRLKAFLSTHAYESIWAKSPSFDISILNSLADSCGIDLAIDFRKERDVRTEMQDYPQFDVREISKHLHVTDSLGHEIGLHNPVYDSIIQLHSMQEVYAAKFTLGS